MRGATCSIWLRDIKLKVSGKTGKSGMSNHFSRIRGYIFLIGSAAPSFPSALFLTFLALHFAQQQRFLLSSILFTSVAIAQVALNPLCSRLLRHVSARRECSLLVIARLLTFTLTGIILALIENERDPLILAIIGDYQSGEPRGIGVFTGACEPTYWWQF